MNRINLKTSILFTDSFRWPHEAILLLLTIYKEHENKMTSGKISVKKFWNVVSCQLIDKGYHVTSIQCKNKMAGLKNTYKSVKDHNSKSGNSTRTWKYFNVSSKMYFIRNIFIILYLKFFGTIKMF